MPASKTQNSKSDSSFADSIQELSQAFAVAQGKASAPVAAELLSDSALIAELGRCVKDYQEVKAEAPDTKGRAARLAAVTRRHNALIGEAQVRVAAGESDSDADSSDDTDS